MNSQLISAVMAVTFMFLLLEQTSCQVEECKDISLLCATMKAAGRCNETMENCQKTCGYCIVTTTGVINTTTIASSTTTVETTTRNKTSAATTTTSTTVVMPSGATKDGTTVTIPTLPTTTTTTRPTTTTTTTTRPTTTTTTTTVTTPTTTVPVAIWELRDAVKATQIDDTDYNMALVVLFLGKVNTTDHAEISKAVEDTFVQFGVTVSKLTMAEIMEGVSKNNSAIHLTSIKWILKVSAAQGQTIGELVEELNSSPKVGYAIETKLPSSVDTSVYGGDDFIVPTEPIPTTTAEKERITKRTGFDSDDWNIIGITIGAGLALILLLVITAVVQNWRGNARRRKMEVAEGSYDFEVSIGRTAPTSELADAKTHL